MVPNPDLTDPAQTRRYFAKFARIITHLRAVAAVNTGRGALGGTELDIVEHYLQALSGTFAALSMKYLLAGRLRGALPSALEIDRTESGFPAFRELLQMANDAMNAQSHLERYATPDALKRQMVSHILSERAPPTSLQFALSQRLYYQQLSGRLFWAQNDPQILPRTAAEQEKRRYLLHWANYDSQRNLPVIYLMLLEDSGREPLHSDDRRWPAVQSHLMAQSIGTLKLVTIAGGFDTDFPDLHPKLLRRIHIGPMYSHAFTEQTGPLREILREAGSQPGEDWVLTWDVESLRSTHSEWVSRGFFSRQRKEIYELDHFSTSPEGPGRTEGTRALILPARPYQALAEADPPGLRGVRKYVVGDGGKVLSHV